MNTIMSRSNDDEDSKVPVPTSAEIIRLLASDDDDEPLTGGTMEKVMKHIKASVCCINIKEFIMIAKQEHQEQKQQQHQKQKPHTSTSHNHTVSRTIPICDARSPGEFALGHIPGATNLPIFTNEERAIVGTMYNKAGRSNATVKGMSIVRPKLGTLVTTAASIVANANKRARVHTQSSTINEYNAGDEAKSDDTSNSNNVLLLHCWRGGMRSCSLAFLIQTQCPDLKVYVLTGGYKAFRKWQYSLYCYLPPNANYSEHHSESKGGRGGSGGAQHHLAGGKRMSQKQKLKAALRKSTAKGIGATRREADIAQANARNRERCEVGQGEKDNAARAEKEMEAEWADTFDQGPRIVIVGGPTGSGKTKVLHALRDVLGEQIIDLEGLGKFSIHYVSTPFCPLHWQMNGQLETNTYFHAHS